MGGRQAQSFLPIALPWVRCKLEKQYLLDNIITPPWESKPFSNRGIMVTIVLSTPPDVGLGIYIMVAQKESFILDVTLK